MLRLAVFFVVAFAGLTAALKLPMAVGRRAALAGLAGLPAAALAIGDDGSFTGYKTRDYGNGQNTATGAKPGKLECAEGERLSPDGFGGKVCKSKVKSVANRVGDAVVGGGDGDAPPPPPSKPKAAAPKAAPKAPEYSAPALTFDDLLANSIKQKEGLIGRELTEIEKDEMSAKLKALMK